jgi:hypothetical protein
VSGLALVCHFIFNSYDNKIVVICEFSDLSSVYPEQQLFKSLLSGLPFQSQSHHEKHYSENLLLRLRDGRRHDERMDGILNEIDKLSDSKPDVLEYFAVSVVLDYYLFCLRE